MSDPTDKLLMALYGGLWRTVQPFLKRHKRLRHDFEQRLVPERWPDPTSSLSANGFCDVGALRIWIQAASGGEAWLVHSLIPALLRRLAAEPLVSGMPRHFLCTTWTRQGLDVLEQLTPETYPSDGPPVRIVPRYFPLDSPARMDRALDLARPHLILLLETELWPGLLFQARDRGVPVMVVNGRMREKTLRGYRRVARLFRAAPPHSILAVSSPDADRFALLFGDPGRVRLMPNIKFDRLASSLQAVPPRDLRAQAGFAETSLLTVLASVREEEEDLLIATLRELLDVPFGGQTAFAVAPRHMHRIAAWKSKLSAAGIPWRLRSQCRSAGGRNCREPEPGLEPLMLWDAFGDLLSLYGMADAVFVGGSLVPLGGQNFLEPAALGLVPLVGPHTGNFHWAGEAFFEQGLGIRVAPERLAETLKKQLHQRRDAFAAAESAEDVQAARQSMAAQNRERFRQWLDPHLGGSAQAAEAITSCLIRHEVSGTLPPK